jgi:rusticyanin
MNGTRLAAVIGTAAVTAAGLGASTAITACGSTAPAVTAAGAPGGPGYAYYQSMMGRFGSGTGPSGSSGMMGGGSSHGWMTGRTGYRQMMGGLDAPAWMTGRALPGVMMGTSRDPGKVMGALFADSPGPRVSPAQSARLGDQIPAGATVSRAQHHVTFPGTTARLTVLASPPGGPDETFRTAGMTDPTITVKAGTRVTIEIINADPDTSHGLVITAPSARSTWMPMLTARPAFTRSAVWFLGNPTAQGMHAATISFTATTPGTYQYLCPVPGHAQKGMTGSFTVSGA